jgi:hypothetical protein
MAFTISDLFNALGIVCQRQLSIKQTLKNAVLQVAICDPSWWMSDAANRPSLAKADAPGAYARACAHVSLPTLPTSALRLRVRAHARARDFR